MDVILDLISSLVLVNSFWQEQSQLAYEGETINFQIYGHQSWLVSLVFTCYKLFDNSKLKKALSSNTNQRPSIVQESSIQP